VFQPNRKPEPRSLRGALNSAYRDRRLILAGMVTILALSIATALLKPPAYTARTSLLVLMSSEYATRPDALSTQATSMMAMERDSILSSEVSILTSRGLARTVLEEAGVGRVYPNLVQVRSLAGRVAEAIFGKSDFAPLDLAVERLMRDLRAVPDKSGSTIEVTYTHPDRSVSAEVLGLLIRAYQKKRSAVFANAQSSLVAVEVNKSRAALEKISSELAAFQKEQDISDFGTQMDLLLRRQAELHRARQVAATSFAESSQRVATLGQQLRKVPSRVVQYADSDDDRRAQAARDNLVDLRRQESELGNTYTDESPKMIAIRRQIAAMESEAASSARVTAPSSVRSGVNQVHSSLELDAMRAEGEVSAARQTMRELQAQTDSVATRIDALREKRTALDDLIRQKAVAEQSYLAGTRALQERRVTEDIDAKKAANVRVIEPAEPPLQASHSRAVILAGGAASSVLAGLAIAVCSDRFRRSYISPDRIESELGIPVLATVSHDPMLRPLSALDGSATGGLGQAAASA